MQAPSHAAPVLTLNLWSLSVSEGRGFKFHSIMPIIHPGDCGVRSNGRWGKLREKDRFRVCSGSGSNLYSGVYETLGLGWTSRLPREREGGNYRDRRGAPRSTARDG